jgi:hypothetical protein
MRRSISITVAVALLAGVAVAVPTAQGARTYSGSFSESHRYFQQHAADLGGVSINVTVVYTNRHRGGKFTPSVVYLKFKAPVSCQVGGTTTASIQSGPFKLRNRKVEFSGSFTNQAPASEIADPGSSGFYFATGRLIKKKNKRKWRVDGTVTVSTYSSPPTFLNCTSGGTLPYAATRCWSSASAKASPPFCTESYPYPTH